jgi:hypothetical protein
MIAQLLTLLLGTFLVATGIAWAIGPARLLANLAAGLVVIPVLWAILTAAALGAWVALRLHGAAP